MFPLQCLLHAGAGMFFCDVVGHIPLCEGHSGLWSDSLKSDGRGGLSLDIRLLSIIRAALWGPQRHWRRERRSWREDEEWGRSGGVACNSVCACLSTAEAPRHGEVCSAAMRKDSFIQTADTLTEMPNDWLVDRWVLHGACELTEQLIAWLA